MVLFQTLFLSFTVNSLDQNNFRNKIPFLQMGNVEVIAILIFSVTKLRRIVPLFISAKEKWFVSDL